MIIDKNPMPKSSFLSMEKDMHLISNMLLKNQRLKKMLHYTTPNCLSKPDLTEDESVEMFGKNIKMIPKLYVDNSVLNYVIISLVLIIYSIHIDHWRHPKGLVVNLYLHHLDDHTTRMALSS